MRHVVKYITACCIAAKVLSQWQSRTSTWWRRVDVYAKVATKETGRTSVACGADLYRCSWDLVLEHHRTSFFDRFGHPQHFISTGGHTPRKNAGVAQLIGCHRSTSRDQLVAFYLLQKTEHVYINCNGTSILPLPQHVCTKFLIV